MDHAYLVRHGLMRHVGLFLADSDAFERGETVVVRSSRGTELGEVLLRRPEGPSAATSARILRAATTEDRGRALRADRERPARLAACEAILRDGIWPLELIDVEPLLEGRRTVLHYLGPHRLDVHGLQSLFRDSCGLDVVFEPVGIDPDEAPEPPPDEGHGCGSCGTEGGGCGTKSEGGGCGTKSEGGGCSGCAVKSLLASRRAPAASR